MCIPAVVAVWAFSILQSGCVSVPTATIRSPFLQIPDGNPFRRSYDWDRGPHAPSSRPSYVIYDRDLNSLPNDRERPQILNRPRPWHLEFNNQQEHYHLRQQSTKSQDNSVGVPVRSNLIEIYDTPRKYYGPYNSKSYGGPYPGYLMMERPSKVPVYDVIYPHESQPMRQYYVDLPDRFPTTFLPEKNFEVKDPPPPIGPPRDIGFFRTQTVNYFGNSYNTDDSDGRVGRRREQCNYIKLNEKGFPHGNELCGRSISDVLLAPDYPNTGDLNLEHRKRYRGVQQGRSLELSNDLAAEKELKTNNTDKVTTARKKRSTQGFQTGFYGRCCDEFPRAYGYRSYGQGAWGNIGGSRDYDYNNGENYRGNGFRPYSTQDTNYGFSNEGQYRNNYDDDYRDEASDNRGQTAYANRNRGQNQDSYENDNKGGSGSSRGQKHNDTRNQSSNGSYHNRHSNNERNSRDGNDDRRSGYGSNNGNYHSTSYSRGRDGDYFGSSSSDGSNYYGALYGSSNGGYDNSRSSYRI